MSTLHHQIHSDNSNKPWILLIHGLFGNLDNLSALRKLFTEQFQVLSIDLPDHGKSACTDSFSFEQYTKLIVELLTELDITETSIIGHSLGGKVAMKLALNQPRLINHLVVIDIAPSRYEARHNNVFQGLNSVDLSTLESRKQADTQLNRYIAESSTRQFLLKSLYHENQQWKWRFNLTLLHRDYEQLSQAITSKTSFNKPVLFIKGQNSDYLSLAHRPYILELFPKSQSKIISDAGHWLHAEKPTLCYKIACTFILNNSMFRVDNYDS
jgi:esterase